MAIRMYVGLMALLTGLVASELIVFETGWGFPVAGYVLLLLVSVVGAVMAVHHWYYAREWDEARGRWREHYPLLRPVMRDGRLTSTALIVVLVVLAVQAGFILMRLLTVLSAS